MRKRKVPRLMTPIAATKATQAVENQSMKPRRVSPFLPAFAGRLSLARQAWVPRRSRESLLEVPDYSEPKGLDCP